MLRFFVRDRDPQLPSHFNITAYYRKGSARDPLLRGLVVGKPFEVTVCLARVIITGLLLGSA